MRIFGWCFGAAALTACPNLGYVYTDPADSLDPPPQNSVSDPTTTPPDSTSGEPTTSGTTSIDPSSTGPGTLPTSVDTTDNPTSATATIPVDTDTGTGTDTDTTGNPAVCGNGVVEGAEACDDGNQDAGDGCEPDCTTTPVCGNGVVEAGEVCDDGNLNDDDECVANCTLVADVCGNGSVDVGEACDDGNLDPGDGCEPDCTITPALCGNGVLDDPEVCDDGDAIDDAPDNFCSNSCVPNLFECAAPTNYVVCDAGLDLADKLDATTAQRAFGLCDDLPDNSVQVDGFTLGAADGASWQVARAFGSHKIDADQDPQTPDVPFFRAREGDAFLMLSTGTIAAPDLEGTVLAAPGSQLTNNDNGNDDTDVLPAPFDPLVGSDGGMGTDPYHACDGVHDCSDSLAADWMALPDPNDAVWFTFTTTVPADTYGYSFDLAYCSSEWPSQINQPAKDLLIAWQSDASAADPSKTPSDPVTGNVATIPDALDPTRALPLTVKSLHPHFLGPGFVFNEPQLADTGFEQHACSSWLTVRGGVRPDAPITLGVLLADRGDNDRATVVLLDNFRWDCEGCDPKTLDECTTKPAL